MADDNNNNFSGSNDSAIKQKPLSDSAQTALRWFRTVFVKAFSQGNISKKTLCKIIEQDTEFLTQLFAVLDNDGSGTLCYQEFAGGLLRLGRGREISSDAFTMLSREFILVAGNAGQVDEDGFIRLCQDFAAKLSEELLRLFDLDNNGCVDIREFLIGLDKLARTDTDIKWYTWAEKWFTQNATQDGRITKEQFLAHLNLTKSSFADSLFGVVDSDQSGTVDVTELMQVIQVLTQGSPKERLIMLFNVYDIDRNGCLNYDGMTTVLKSCLSDSSLDTKCDLVERLTDVLFVRLDKDNSGDVTLEEFEDFLNQYPKITENLTISFAHCLHPRRKKPILSRKKLRRNLDRAFAVMVNNKPVIAYWFIFVAVNVTLFVTAAKRYWDDHSIFIVLARGAGQCLNFNSVFVVVLMYRYIFTYLRSTRLMKYLPLDHSIKAHKATGQLIVLFSLVHMTMHIGNAELQTREGNTTLTEYLFTLQDGVGWVGGSACITGWVLVVVLAAIVITSLPCIRRRGCFQLFYWSHWFFILWWATLIIHASRFWMWVIGPACVYFAEKIWRHIYGRERTAEIRSIRSVDSKVSEVIIERPRLFRFNAGDYIFIQIKDIARFEWHPFTISSAPENSDYISLHVQAVGDWTKRLRALGDKWSSQMNVPRERTLGQTMRSQLIRRRGGFPDCEGDAPKGTPIRKSCNISFTNFAFEDEFSPPFRSSVRRNAQFPLNSTRKTDKQPVSLLLMRTRTPPGTRPSEESSSYEQVYRNAPNKVRVRIDGPYGSPSTTVYAGDHVILIGAGIGVTPFSSILQSIMSRRKRHRAICPNCKYWWKVQANSIHTMAPRKVDFIWVTRTFDSLEWFLDVLCELEEEQALFDPQEHFLNIRLHITSALVQSDIRAVALQMALQLCHQEDARDPLCGLRTRIEPGRPNWRKVFDNTLSTADGKVSVFYCGPPGLEKTLEKLCNEYRLDFKAERF